MINKNEENMRIFRPIFALFIPLQSAYHRKAAWMGLHHDSCNKVYTRKTKAKTSNTGNNTNGIHTAIRISDIKQRRDSTKNEEGKVIEKWTAWRMYSSAISAPNTLSHTHSTHLTQWERGSKDEFGAVAAAATTTEWWLHLVGLMQTNKLCDGECCGELTHQYKDKLSWIKWRRRKQKEYSLIRHGGNKILFSI